MPMHRRDACVLILLLCVGFAAHAQWQRATPAHGPDVLQIARDVRTDPGELPRLKLADGTLLPLTHTAVEAEVSGPVARVEVTQRYANHNAMPIEAIYVFPLPENSAVDAMRMQIGDRIVEAKIQERAAARRTYEQAKRAGKTAALLEQERPNIFTQSVANIAPGEAIEVTVRYVQHLTYDAGQYEFVFPMVVGPRFIPGQPISRGRGFSPNTTRVPDAARITPPILGRGTRPGHDISFTARVDPGFPVADFGVPTHHTEVSEHDGVLQVALAGQDRLPNRDLVMRWRVDAETPQTQLMVHRAEDGDGGFFTLIVLPPALDLDAAVGRRELIFVVDVSGSMNGVPLSMAKDAMRGLLAGTRPVDTFNVVTFAGRTGALWPAPRAANESNLTLARQFIDGQRAGGGTHMAEAVQRALQPGDPARHRYVVFLTDGYIGNEHEIFAGAERLVARMAERGQRAKVFSLGLGSSVNRHLIEGIAKAGDGIAQVPTPRERPQDAVNRLQRAIDMPLLQDVHIDWGGLPVDEVQPRFLPDLFATRPLVVHGRYRGEAHGTITVEGQLNGQALALPVDVMLPKRAPARGALKTLWARAKIAELERDMWQSADAATRQAILALGLEFGIVTRFTSFVAVDHTRIVSGGGSKTVVQPTVLPEGVDAATAAPSYAYPKVSPAPRTRRTTRRRPRPPMRRPVMQAPASAAPVSAAMRSRPMPRRAARSEEVDDLLSGFDGGGRKARGRASKPADPELPSRLSKRQILQLARAWNAALQEQCPIETSRTFKMTLVFRSDGDVELLRLRKGALPPAQEKCVREQAKSWRGVRFGGSEVRVSVPFRLGPR